MKIFSNLTLALLLASPSIVAYAHEEADEFCSELESFLTSVKPEETRGLTLRTFWGARVEGDNIVMGSKTCGNPPTFSRHQKWSYAAIASFIAGVMPPSAMLGRSWLYVQSQRVAFSCTCSMVSNKVVANQAWRTVRL